MITINCSINDNPEPKNDSSNWQKIDVGFAKKPIDFEIADFDNDGDQDIFSFESHANKIVWFENSDFGKRWTKNLIIEKDTTIIQPHGSDLADMNNDNHKDLILGSHASNYIYWFDIHNKWEKNLITDNSFGHELATMDFDKDGNEDIVTVYHPPNSKEYGLDLILNTKTKSDEWSVYKIDPELQGAFSVYIADIDNDGYDDIVSNSYNEGKMVWYKNLFKKKSDQKFEKYVIANLDDCRESIPYDLDKDGDLDLITSNYANKPESFYHSKYIRKLIKKFRYYDHNQHINTSKGELLWYENTSNGTKWIKHVIDSDIQFSYVAEVGDIDGDMKPDIIATSGRIRYGANVPGSVQWYKIIDDDLYKPWQKHIIDINKNYEARGIGTGDFNANGRLDIVVGYGDHDGEVKLYLR